MRLAWILFLAFLVLVACVVGSSNRNIEGGPGDKLHPNRVGYQAMGNSINLLQLMTLKSN